MTMFTTDRKKRKKASNTHTYLYKCVSGQCTSHWPSPTFSKHPALHIRELDTITWHTKDARHVHRNPDCSYIRNQIPPLRTGCEL